MVQGTIKNSVWTSASSEGDSCDLERTFMWCSTGTLMSETDVLEKENWDPAIGIPDGSASNEKCLVLNYNATTKKVALGRSTCQGNRSFLCEVRPKV